MNSPESLNTKSKNLFELITTNWENLDESQKSILTKIWKVLTYKSVSYTHLTLPTTPYV